MTNKERFNTIVLSIKDEIPEAEIRFKNESILFKIIGIFICLFNSEFMLNYTTTLYPRVYFPSRKWLSENYDQAWKILAHEWVHLIDRKYYGILFDIGYLLPQLLIILSYLAFLAIPFSNWWLLALIFLVFLAPIPSPWRRDFELRGYTMTMAIDYWTISSVNRDTYNLIINQFAGSWYYFMWPFSSDIERRLYNIISDLKLGIVESSWQRSSPYRKMKAILYSEHATFLPKEYEA